MINKIGFLDPTDGTVLRLPTYPAQERNFLLLTFIFWCILLVFCWPLALAALVLYPIIWLLLLPFRLAGIAVDGALKLVWAIITLPVRLLSSPGRV